MKLGEAYGKRYFVDHVVPVTHKDVKKPQNIKKKTKNKKKPDNILIRLGNSLDSIMNNTSSTESPVYIIQLKVSQDDTHLLCMFILVFLISLIFTRK